MEASSPLHTPKACDGETNNCKSPSTSPNSQTMRSAGNPGAAVTVGGWSNLSFVRKRLRHAREVDIINVSRTVLNLHRDVGTRYRWQAAIRDHVPLAGCHGNFACLAPRL